MAVRRKLQRLKVEWNVEKKMSFTNNTDQSLHVASIPAILVTSVARQLRSRTGPKNHCKRIPDPLPTLTVLTGLSSISVPNSCLRLLGLV
jgi:hypothetical protein